MEDVNGSYFAVFNAHNPGNLVEVGRVYIPGSPRRFEIIGNEVYMAAAGGMTILSLDRMGTPEFGTDGDGDGWADDITGYIETEGAAVDVDVKGDYAYIADGAYQGVKVVDITDRSAPVEIGEIEARIYSGELEIEGNYLYYMDSIYGMKVVRLYLAETKPSIELDRVSMDVHPSTMTMTVTGGPGTVYDDIYPLIVSVKSAASGQEYTVDVDETDSGAFTVTLPWIPGDDLYITVTESTPDPVAVGPYHLGLVPVGAIVGEYPVGASGQRVDVSGNIAVIGEDKWPSSVRGRLTVLDISDPMNPVKLGSLDLNYYIYQIRIKGDRVYVANYNTVTIIDISDPANPVQVSFTYKAYNFTIDVANDTAFVGRRDHYYGWRNGYIDVYDIRDEKNPVLKSSKDLGEVFVRDVRIDGETGLLYAAVEDVNGSYFAVFNTHNPANLVEVGRVYIPGSPRRFEIIGNEVYMAAVSGMTILSLDRMGTPEFGTDGNGDGWADDITGYIETEGSANDVDVKGDYAYIADGAYQGVKVVDISDGSAPVEIGKIGTPNQSIELEISGNYLYLADGLGGLKVMDMYQPAP